MALRWKDGIDHFATFRFADPAAAPRAHARSVRDFAKLMREGLAFDRAEIGDPFGDEELSMFTIEFEYSLFGGYNVNIGVSAHQLVSDQLWDLHVQARDLGMLERHWRPKLETIRKVELKLHARLLELGALDLRWRLQERRDDPGQATP